VALPGVDPNPALLDSIHALLPDVGPVGIPSTSSPSVP
jgi:hypothetical protein